MNLDELVEIMESSTDLNNGTLNVATRVIEECIQNFELQESHARNGAGRSLSESVWEESTLKDVVKHLRSMLSSLKGNA